jgi:hypothetical protein
MSGRKRPALNVPALVLALVLIGCVTVLFLFALYRLDAWLPW